MEQLHHVIIYQTSSMITFCGDRGSQKTFQFRLMEEFLFAVEHCQQKLLPQHIYYC